MNLYLLAVSFFSFSVLIAAWPWLHKNDADRRLQESIVRISRGMPREATCKLTLKREPHNLFREIVSRFDLWKQTEDEQLRIKLSMAGYRGNSAIVTYLAFLVLTPLFLTGLSTIYVLNLTSEQMPILFKAFTILLCGYLGCHFPNLYIRNKIVKRQHALRKFWPDALDLLLICIESGMSIESSLRRVADDLKDNSEEISQEFYLTLAELSYLQDRRQAFENLSQRTGLELVKAVVTCLLQTEQYGTALGQALRVLSQEGRDVRMSEAEKKAAALPPKLTVPMIIFFLPVLFAVIITPAIIQHLQG